ncbi:unnamed protein product, partial [Symbiodinium necroappetens]
KSRYGWFGACRIPPLDVDSFAGASGCSGRADVSNRAADGTAEGSKADGLRSLGNCQKRTSRCFADECNVLENSGRRRNRRHRPLRNSPSRQSMCSICAGRSYTCSGRA